VEDIFDMSNPTSRFSHKADKYAKYRWDYSPQAIDAIFDITNLSNEATVADIGAGTGMLSQHFVGRVKAVYAIEPNAEMRQSAEKILQASTTYKIIEGFAEAIPLPDHSIDLIVVGRAIHWFDPFKAKREFLRIVKPDDWLAILHVPCTDSRLVEAIKSIRTKENGWDVSKDKNKLQLTPSSFYFGSNKFSIKQYPDTIHETWPEFFGRLSSLSPAPDESHEFYSKYKEAALEIYRQFSVGGCLTVNIATELHLGRITVD
jgi:ubiquinone/menaquinone biosynthesis C-methylase UbiE